LLTDQTPSSAADAPDAVPSISATIKARHNPTLPNMTILSPRNSRR
jgi:hypothetical protein